MLFLKKTNQQYWWLWGLAVLQISVGASQSTEGLYGIFLCLYLFLALWTLSVFSLFQGQQQFDHAQQVAETTGVPEREPSANRPPPSHKAALHPTGFNGFWKQPSQATGSVQRDPNASWIDVRFVGGVLGTAAVAFVVAMLFFFLIPRHPSIWRRSQTFANKPTESLTGFSRNLSLGDIGQILESRKKVMEVRLTDYQTGAIVNIERYAVDMGYEEPLFRGMTAIHYQGGEWKTWGSDEETSSVESFLPGLLAPRGRFVQQHIRLEAVDSELLFVMPPARYGEMNASKEPITIERLNDILKRPDRKAEKSAADYKILSPLVSETPGAIPIRRLEARFIRSWPDEYLRIPSELTALKQLAEETAGANGQPRPGELDMARRLERFLKYHGGFAYTLNANVADPKIDPLEDFLFNRKQGHCEYFASALVLMLRAVGIPARLASGFKGGTYNETTGLFVVEERHAHAWVEAFINESWVILDPTPAGRAESVASIGEAQSGLMDFTFIVRNFWTRFIVNLDVNEQRRLLEPFKILFNNAIAWLRNGRGHLTKFIQGLREQLQSPERWISWQGGLVTFVLLSVMSALVWLVRVLTRLFVRLRAQYFNPEGLARTVAFYERFRRICAAAGWTRKASQTPKEFALEVRRRLRELFPQAEEKDFPLLLIEAYYEVRYGGRLLGSESLDRLEQELTRFEAFLSQPDVPSPLGRRWPKAG